ncbi:MAG TPA: pilus assembly protein TadG-related protein, partial [Dehalococcoidia bacterium]|nr:pilus assembly protein TadG-related protein [Dehalococcoidia bacterium]
LACPVVRGVIQRRSRLREQKGQILVLVAIMMPVMLAFVGLVLDGGFIYGETRRAQAAADAIALAAGTHMWYNTAASVDCTTETGSGTDTCGVLPYATALSYTAANNDTVTVTHPAETSGTYASAEYHGRGDYVKVRIQRTIPQFIIGIIFKGTSTADVTAIAGIARVPMLYALVSLGDPCASADNGTSPAYAGGIIVSGNSTLTVNNGAVMSNCSSSAAINVAGSGDSLTTDSFDVNGTCTQASGATLSPSCSTGIAQISDPMGSLPWPCSSAATGNNGSSPYCTSRGAVNLGGAGACPDQVLDPGVYTSITGGCNGTVWLKKGVYVIQGGGIAITGTAAIKVCDATGAPAGCTGATGGALIYNATNEYDGERVEAGAATKCDNGTSPSPTSAAVSFQGSGGFDIRAMTSGSYSGLALWQGCGITNAMTLQGTPNSQVVGTTYLPEALLSMGGNASWTTPSAVVSKYTHVNGSVNLTMDYNHSLGYKPWKVVLVQ